MGLKRISISECLKPSKPSFLRLITPDLQEGAMPNLSTKEGREALEELIQGAAFEVFFEKTRHFAGEDATSFQVQLKEQEDGLWLWEVSGSKPVERVMEIAEAVKEGLTIKQMQQRTGLTKSQVETCKKKAKEQGLI